MVLTEWPINSVERWDLLDELLEHGRPWNKVNNNEIK
jgi:hypothetical protein